MMLGSSDFRISMRANCSFQGFLPTVNRRNFVFTGLVGETIAESDEVVCWRLSRLPRLSCEPERSRVSCSTSSSDTLRSDQEGATEVSRISVNLELEGMVNVVMCLSAS
jgi:hypothetical protein